MNKYKLLTLSSGNRGSGLFWLGLILLAAAAVHQFYLPFLGPYAIIVWGLGGLAWLIALLLRIPTSLQSGYVQIEPDVVTIRYGRQEVRLGYDEIDTIAGSRVSQHHSLREFSRRERQAVKPYFNQTHIFITLHDDSNAWVEAQQKLPTFMLGSTQPGIVLLVEGDWLAVERAIDAARVEWLGHEKETHQYNDNTIAFEFWGDDEYDDDELDE